ncbi:MAG: UbiA family prenyltransferase [Candidatus Thermoplasmatota archaeon]
MKEEIGFQQKLFAHIETWRPYTVIWCGLVSLAGACIAFQKLPPLRTAVLTFFIPVIGWIAALYLSDYLDRNLDAIEKPHRPIPSERIKPKEALIAGGIFALSGAILTLLFLNLRNILLVFIVAVLVLTYTKVSKSHGILGHFNRGIVTITAYFFGVFSVGKSLSTLPIYIWFLSLVFLLHDFNSNMVGAIRDSEGDKKGGYITIPVKYGIKNSIWISLFLTCIWFSTVLIIPLYYDFLNIYFYVMMVIDISILISLYIYLFNSLGGYSRKKALKFHEFFVIERITLASSLISGVIEIKLAIVIYLISFLVTFVSQETLRKRYEFVVKK